MIEVHGLQKAYGEQKVLKGIELAVRDGEVFGFVGPNGAGKSTFLKCVLGIARCDSGSVRLGNGDDVIDALRKPLEARLRVGYSPGETSLYQSLRADDFLRFALAHYRSADLAEGLSLMERLSLPLHKRIKSFSHGMKRKLLLAQALASRAPVLMLDEPMEGLDPEARRIAEQLLTDAASVGRTVFFSSHDLSSVERICDRVAFLRSGKIMETGRIHDILARASRTLHLTLEHEIDVSMLPERPGWDWEGAGTRWRLTFEDDLAFTLARLQSLPIVGIRDGSGRLEDVFESLYGPDAPDHSTFEEIA
ncbi:MAG: ABC transporter ATP-binding protein [Planctomycetes bacterium]|nr:ABC transporter ATP-binding protein [Planctomycetota bacterium]